MCIVVIIVVDQRGMVTAEDGRLKISYVSIKKKGNTMSATKEEARKYIIEKDLQGISEKLMVQPVLFRKRHWGQQFHFHILPIQTLFKLITEFSYFVLPAPGVIDNPCDDVVDYGVTTTK